MDGAVVYGLTYDGFGRTISTKAGSSPSSLAALATNTYNNTSGLFTQTAYANGLTVSYVYDSLDRPVEVKYNGTSMYKYVYDGAGNLYSAQDVALGFTIFYEYDHTGRCMKSVTKNSAGTVLASYQYQYDGNNNLTKLTCSTNGSTWATTYAYDKDNRPTTATLANGVTVTNSYDPIGRLARVVNGPNTAVLNYHRNKLDETLRSDLLYLYQNNEDAPFLYAYDNNRNITHIQQDTAHIYYQYDALNQLTREDNSVLNKSIVYTYDDRGNLLTKQEYAYVADGGTLSEPTATITYGYEAENQTWADQLTSYNGEAIRYDASGNPTTYRGYTMTWQGRRLTGATDGTTTTAYTYNENGLRTQKVVNGTATQYRYHGSVLISQVTGTDTLLFGYDANGNVVAVNYNGTYYYYVRNGQNDVIRLIDGNNNTVVEYSYDSWGRLLSCTGSLASTLGTQNPFRYRGYVYDAETGLYYLQTRYYDPEVGRFINADIYMSNGQGVLGHNMYVYCLNNPIALADTTGGSAVSTFSFTTAICDGGCGTIRYSLNEPTHGEALLAGIKAAFDFVTNTDAEAVVKAKYFAFYRGKLVIKHNVPGQTSCSMFGILFINSNDPTTPHSYHANETTVQHEYGHAVQYDMMGTGAYIVKIVIPSLSSYYLDVPEDEYYSLPWERSADILGGVERKLTKTDTPYSYYPGSGAFSLLYLLG